MHAAPMQGAPQTGVRASGIWWARTEVSEPEGGNVWPQLMHHPCMRHSCKTFGRASQPQGSASVSVGACPCNEPARWRYPCLLAVFVLQKHCIGVWLRYAWVEALRTVLKWKAAYVWG
jgi:hypothetical protein